MIKLKTRLLVGLKKIVQVDRKACLICFYLVIVHDIFSLFALQKFCFGNWLPLVLTNTELHMNIYQNVYV